DNSPTYIIYTLSLHDALPIFEDCNFTDISLHAVELRGVKYAIVRNNHINRAGGGGIWAGAKSVDILAHTTNNASFRNESIWIERSEEHTSELQSRENLVCRLL